MREILGLVVALFFAAFVQATTGFGFALVAMPLLTLAIGFEVAWPLTAVVSLVLNVVNVLRLRAHLQWRELWRMAGAAAIGILPGFWLQSIVPAGPVRVTLGVIVLSYALYSLLQPRASLSATGCIYPAGFLGGVLGAAYNISGPPVIIYGDLRGWARDEYRATLQAFFFLIGVLLVSGHVVLGHFNGRRACAPP